MSLFVSQTVYKVGSNHRRHHHSLVSLFSEELSISSPFSCFEIGQYDLNEPHLHF